METTQPYKSFSGFKSLEDVLYNLKYEAILLSHLQFELQCYQSLLLKPIFKPQVMNLFEVLEKFKTDVDHLENDRLNLLREIQAQIHQIKNKTPKNNLNKKSLFIEQLDRLTLEIHHFQQNLLDFKMRFFEYLKSAILD